MLLMLELELHLESVLSLVCFAEFSILSIKLFTDSLESCRWMADFCCRRTAISCCTDVMSEFCDSFDASTGKRKQSA
uniref:Putative secreted protein n=1 Tax=Anopheles darlingi TaxID=43151 RepID=A0A2M4D2Z0_ANODA